MGVYFLAYEHLCCVLKKLWYHSEIKNKTMPKHIQLIAGGLAGKYMVIRFVSYSDSCAQFLNITAKKFTKINRSIIIE